MITKIKEVYYCEYCKKRYLRKDFMERHEKLCYHNPANKRACHGCDGLTQEDAMTYFTHIDYFGERRVASGIQKVFYCTVKKLFLHIPQNEIKGRIYNLGEEENHPMPKECNGFMGI